MTTIPQRLRDIARNGPFDERRSAIFKLADEIAAELEAPAADAVPVVATIESKGGKLELAWCMSEAKTLHDGYHRLVTEEDHIATVAALQQQLGAVAKAAGDAEAQAVATVNRLHAEVAALQEETASLRQQLADLADRQQYKGNSVSFIYQKKDAYASAIDKVFDVLGKHGHKADGSTHIADLTDKALCALQARINELEADLAHAHRAADLAAKDAQRHINALQARIDERGN